MATSTTKRAKNGGSTQGCQAYALDLIHELSKRSQALGQYDQCLANAEGHPHLQEFWRTLKRQDQEYLQRLKDLVEEEIRNGCFY
jgi:hypothetical protein